MSSTQDLGLVTAYGYAVEGGYTGTEAEFMALLGSQQTYHDEAVQAAEDAEAYAAQAMSGTPDGYASLVSTVNSLNSALTVTRKDYACSVNGINGTIAIMKYGRVCIARGTLTGSFSNVSAGDVLATITDADYKPVLFYTSIALGRDSGSWESANYYHCAISLNTNGTIAVNGNNSDIRAIGYLPLWIAYISAS